MKRRDFSVSAAALVLAGSAAWAPALAQSRKPQAGWEYFQLGKRVPVEAPQGTIEVVEFFWYNCPHCNAFEPSLEAWQKRLPADVVLRRVPVGFRDEFVPQQRLFFTLQEMGLTDKLHARVLRRSMSSGWICRAAPRLPPGSGSRAWTRRNSVPSTTRPRSANGCAKRPSCRMHMAWPVFRRSVSPGGSIPMARWPAPWRGCCKWSTTCWPTFAPANNPVRLLFAAAVGVRGRRWRVPGWMDGLADSRSSMFSPWLGPWPSTPGLQ